MIGLANLGNTCYVNSVLQMLFSFNDFTNEFEFQCNTQIPLVKSLSILFNAMKTSTNNLSPISLKRNLDSSMPNFKDKIEHDAHEFLMGLIDFLHKNSNHKLTIQNLNQYSSKMYQDSIVALKSAFDFKTYISDSMYLNLSKKLVCRDCSFVSYKFEHYLSLDLYLQNKNDTLPNILHRHFDTDYIYIECDNCGAKERNVEHSVESTINKLPKFFFIMLKRFTFANGLPSKNNNKIDIPESLDISKFYSTLDSSSVHYSLKSVICHKGKSIDSGHYFTISKDTNLNFWNLFDDTKVIKGICKDINEIDSSLPYILAYEMKTMQN